MTQRRDYIDELKGLGILLVVFGHFMEQYRMGYSFVSASFFCIYAFHMALFCTCSGLVARFNPRKLVTQQLWLYLVGQVIMFVFRAAVLRENFAESGGALAALLLPWRHMWYLYALVFWHLTLPVLCWLRDRWRLPGTCLGLALAVCLLNRRRYATADRDEFCRKCLLLLAACGVLAVFVRDGELSYTGTGLLMLLFVLFILMSIAFQHNFTYGETIEAVSTSDAVPSSRLATKESGYTAHTMAFPVMSVRNSLKNRAGVIGGLALLAGGAMALVYSATTLANLTGTIQALWAVSLISFGFCLPLLAEALEHPLGSVWKRFTVRCRYYPPDSLPIQLLNSAILNLTLALPISSLMYRHKLPVGAQFRSYEVPVCAAMALVLLLPPLCKHKLKRWQGGTCMALYFAYLAAALFVPRAGA